MTDKQKYEDAVIEAGEVKRDLDVVYQPIMKDLKKAFTVVFGGAGFIGSDFKRLADYRFYSGGVPKMDSPAKESNLAFQVAQVLKLEYMLGNNKFFEFLSTYGVTVNMSSSEVQQIDDSYTLSKDDESDLRKAWEGAGIDETIPSSRKEALELLLDRSQNVIRDIVDLQQMLADKAAKVEEDHQITKTNFMKAATLHAVKLKKGPGAAGEKVDVAIDNAENLIKALEPLVVNQ